MTLWKKNEMNKDNIQMFVLMFFSASMVIAGGIAGGMEWLSSQEGIPPVNRPISLFLVGVLGLVVSEMLRSLRCRISKLEEQRGAD